MICLITFLVVILMLQGSVSTKPAAYKPLVITSDRFLSHKPMGYHPECPDRISACLHQLNQMKDRYDIRKPSGELHPDNYLFAREIIRRAHDKAYMNQVYTMCMKNAPYLSPYDQDTYISSSTWDQCILAQSAWIDCVNAATNDRRMAFALTRPPGHHACTAKGMGFCIFNFAVGAALYALDYSSAQRVAILDFDVHYGNGVAEMISHRSNIRYCSLHEENNFPNTGHASVTGHYNNILNIPLPSGTKWKGLYQEKLIQEAIPYLQSFQPDLAIICAGYDAMASDELSTLLFQPQDYYELATILKKAFTSSTASNSINTFTGNANARTKTSSTTAGILFGLEGGYNLQDLPQAVIATLDAFVE